MSPLAHWALEHLGGRADSLTWLRVVPGQQAVGRIRASHTTAIVKVFIGSRHGLSAHERFHRERGVLERCSHEHGSDSAAPRLIAASVKHRWLLQEDLGFEPAPGEWSRSLLVQLAGALAVLHRDTGAQYHPGAHLSQWRSRRSNKALHADLGSCGAKASAAQSLLDGLSSLAATIPGNNVACTHGDLALDNLRPTPSGLRLVDFEFAADSSPAQDLAAIHLGLPTAVEPVRFREEDLRAFDANYRRMAGSHGTPDRDALAAAGAWWLLLVLSAHLPGLDVADRVWGGLSVRRRVVARLALFARLAAGQPVAEAATVLAGALSGRWSVAPDLPGPITTPTGY